MASSVSPAGNAEVERTYSKMIVSAKLLEADPFAAIAEIKTPSVNVIDIPFSNGDATYPAPETSAYYYIEGSTITFMFSPESIGSSSNGVWDVVTFRKSLPLGTALGQNAFGIKRRISLQENQIGKIQVRSLPEGMNFPGHSSIPGDDYWRQFEIEGPSTKALLNDLVVRLEVVWLGDALDPQNNCSSTLTEATVERPVEVATYECTALAAISRISFVNKRTKEIIDAWPQL